MDVGGRDVAPHRPADPNWITPKEDYEKDVLDQVAKSPVAKAAPIHGQPATKIRVFNLREELVRGAEVSIVGLAEANTDDYGYVEFGLPYKDFYAVVIKFEDHEEILYQELLSPGASYTYTPDASITNGRLMVLSEEHEAAP